MSQTFNAAVSVVGIDIGKNSFHVVGHDERGAIVLAAEVVTWQVEARALPTCRHAWSAWKPASARIISAASLIALATMPG